MKQREEVEKVCKYCDIKYLTRANISHFCSKNCRIDHGRKKKETELLKTGIINVDYVICQICGSPVGSVTGQHLKKYHPEYSTESYKSTFPEFLTMSEKLTASVTAGSKNAGARMREPEHRARMSEAYSGINNPMHRSKTTDEKRRSVSPFSPDFYLKKDPNISIEAAKKLASKKLTDTKIVSWVKKEYWMNKGMSEEDAILTVSKKQKTFSLDICIEKHGEVEGKKIWLDRQMLWSKNYKKLNYSKKSQDLFRFLYELIVNDFENIHFATLESNKKYKSIDDNKNYEYRLMLNNMVIMPDLIILDNKSIIEFDGTYWHNHIKRNLPENAKREGLKNREITNSGYRLLRITETEWDKSPAITIKKCIDFIYGNT